jgi:hypothetical protein
MVANFCCQQDAEQLLATFHTNGTVTISSFQHFDTLQDGALGTCLLDLMPNIPQLNRLDCENINQRCKRIER